MAATSPMLLLLTPEELTALLEALEPATERLPYADLLPDYTEEQRGVALGLARRVLVARLLLNPDAEGPERLNPISLAVAGSVLLARPASGVVRETPAGASRSTEFYDLGETTYLTHTLGNEGLHQFVLLPGPEEYRQAIVSALGASDQIARHDQPLRLERGALDRVLTLAQSGDLAGSRAVLEEAGVERVAADRLADALAGSLEFRSLIRYARGEGPDAEGRGLLFLATDDALWHIDFGADGESTGQATLYPLAGLAAQSLAASVLGLATRDPAFAS